MSLRGVPRGTTSGLRTPKPPRADMIQAFERWTAGARPAQLAADYGVSVAVISGWLSRVSEWMQDQRNRAASGIR